MLPFILAAFIVAKLRKLKPSVVFKEVSLIPMAVIEIVYVFFVVSACLGNYSFVKYAREIQLAFGISLIFPILRYKLWKTAYTGLGLTLVGTVLNKIVINANDGVMPVFSTFTFFTKYCRKGSLGTVDSLHIIMSSQTKLNFLADYIDTGFTVLSIGDIMIHSFVSIVIFAVIKILSKELQDRKGI